MKLLLLILCLALSGCSALSIYRLNVEGAKGYALCVEGEGPPLTGGGKLAAGKVDKDFKGSISVAADCSIEIVSE